jgi:hypothetical protein
MTVCGLPRGEDEFTQEVLLRQGAISFRTDLPKFAKLFSGGYIYEWNICDSCCVKVLGPLCPGRAARPGRV